MSASAILISRESRTYMWLGKPVHSRPNGVPGPEFFHPATHFEYVWEDPTAQLVFWKFLELHCGGRLEILVDEAWHRVFDAIIESGGTITKVGDDEGQSFIRRGEFLWGVHAPMNWPALALAPETRTYFLVAESTATAVELGQQRARPSGERSPLLCLRRERESPSVDHRARSVAPWKFLAHHCGGEVRIVDEGELAAARERASWKVIGPSGDTSFEEYLEGWPHIFEEPSR